jgi:hypothetical protein
MHMFGGTLRCEHGFAKRLQHLLTAFRLRFGAAQ